MNKLLEGVKDIQEKGTGFKKPEKSVESNITKIAVLPDVHCPENIGLEPVYRYIHDLKPNYLVLLGDFMDEGGISRHNKNNNRDLEGKRLLEDVRKGNEILDNLDRSIPKKCKKVYVRGNHEEWLDQHCNEFAYLDGVLDLASLLKLKKRKYEVTSLNIPYRIGKYLIFVHGLYTGMHHAKKHALGYKSSIIYGHLHDIQTHTEVSPYDRGDFIAGFCMGCLCNKNPKFMKNRPDNWVNGFGTVYINNDTDYFNVYTTTIVNGSFIGPDGKYYEG